MAKRQCKGKNKQGGPCGRAPRVGTDWCDPHNPEPAVQAKVAADQLRGLMAAQAADRSTCVIAEGLLPQLGTREGRLEAVQFGFEGLMSGRVSVAKARALPALVKAAQDQTEPDRLGELEERVGELLREVERRERREPWE